MLQNKPVCTNNLFPAWWNTMHTLIWAKKDLKKGNIAKNVESWELTRSRLTSWPTNTSHILCIIALPVPGSKTCFPISREMSCEAQHLQAFLWAVQNKQSIWQGMGGGGGGAHGELHSHEGRCQYVMVLSFKNVAILKQIRLSVGERGYAAWSMTFSHTQLVVLRV